MTLAILIISFSITYYIYKKTNNKENYLNEKLLLFMQLIACVVWFVVSIIDFYNYGNLVFSPSVDIFIKDIMTGFIVLAISMLLWVISIFTSGKSFKKMEKNIEEEDVPKSQSHPAPNISVDYSSNQNDSIINKGYFPYGNDPYNR